MNNIEKLELKHLCGYLPHGLKIAVDEYSGQLLLDTVLGITNDEIIGENDSYQFDVKPLLLPLSALTEPMEDGTVPIVELAKIAYPKSDTIKLDIEDGTAVIDSAENYRFEYKNGSFECYYLKYSPRVENCFVPNQIQLFEYLYSKHFDIYGLIPVGLAIDKRIINNYE